MIALLLVIAAALASVILWQGNRDARAAIESRAATAVYLASTHVKSVIESSFVSLDGAADLIARGEPVGSARLQEALQALPPGSRIRLYDADGRLTFPIQERIPADATAAEDYFKALKGGAKRYIGRLEMRSDVVLFKLASRLATGGAFEGVAVLSIPVETFSSFWVSLQLGPGSTFGLSRDDGWLVARYPPPQSSLNMAGNELFTKYLAKEPSGVYTAAASPLDGVERLSAYRRVDGLPLVAAVGIPIETLNQSFAKRADEVLAVIAPFALGLLLVSAWLVAQLRERETMQQSLVGALAHNKVLFREIHHRVKNNLQTVAALIRLGPSTGVQKDELIRRIMAMSAAHEQMYATDQFQELLLSDYVTNLISGLQASNNGQATIECKLDPLRVGVDKAMPLGLIVNEVVTNALKHAFPAGQPGYIRVSLTSKPPHHAALEVRDNGVGSATSTHIGMGTRLIEALSKQISGAGEVVNDNGTVFRLDFPVD